MPLNKYAHAMAKLIIQLLVDIETLFDYFLRTKNTVNILIKTMVDGLIGALAYWSIGWALAYGPGSNGFIGESNFFRLDLSVATFILLYKSKMNL